MYCIVVSCNEAVQVLQVLQVHFFGSKWFRLEFTAGFIWPIAAVPSKNVTVCDL